MTYRPQRLELICQRLALATNELSPGRDLLCLPFAGLPELILPGTARIEEPLAGLAAESTLNHSIQDGRELLGQCIAVLGLGVFGDPVSGGGLPTETGQHQAKEERALGRITTTASSTARPAITGLSPVQAARATWAGDSQ